MTYTFSDGLRELKPSAIREILKYSAVPGVVPLSAGNPAPEAFPADAVADISDRLLRQHPIDALQYGATEGYGPLREHLKAYLHKKYAVGGDNDEVLITTGAQQVMGLAAKTLCNDGDVILCEDPSFIGSLNSFRSQNLRLCGIPVQPDGIDTDALEQALKTCPNVRFLYTIPNFQNPSGVTMSMAKRERVYALAKQYGILIVEDNPYGDLRFAGEFLPAIKTLDADGIVIYAGSFSKVISPGIRVGFAVAPREVFAKMVVAKQGEDVHTTLWSQIICHEFMTQYDYEAHLKRLQEIYRRKATRMMTLLQEHLTPLGITYLPVQGGLFIWCTLPDGVDMPSFCSRAVKEFKVAVVPGSAFLADAAQPCQSFRINFSTPTDEAMERGIRSLADCFRAVK